MGDGGKTRRQLFPMVANGLLSMHSMIWRSVQITMSLTTSVYISIS